MSEIKELKQRVSEKNEMLARHRDKITELEAEAARLREALEYIARQNTGQLAPPAQCSMVAVAMEALVAGRDSKEVAK